MRTSVIVSLIYAIGLVTRCASATPDQTKGEEYEALYQRWHQALEAHPYLTEPMLFMTEGVPQDLSTVVTEMKRKRMGMAMFLCEKIATEQKVDYFDIRLLDYVAGVNLWFVERPSGNSGEDLSNSVARFREEWRQGIYKDPSIPVAGICEERLSKEGNKNIQPRDLSALRRYGIFGLPELIRQIKKHNSKHAFAAYLIITGEPDKYAEYIQRSNQQFATKEDKLKDVGVKVEELKASGGADLDLTKKISSALAN